MLKPVVDIFIKYVHVISQYLLGYIMNSIFSVFLTSKNGICLLILKHHLCLIVCPHHDVMTSLFVSLFAKCHYYAAYNCTFASTPFHVKRRKTTFTVRGKCWPTHLHCFYLIHLLLFN